MFQVVSFLIITAVSLRVRAQDVVVADYGVDCSFPIHSKEFRCGDRLGDRQTFYDNFMEGCRKHYGKKGVRCDSFEDDRIEMNLRQPHSMVNYTSTGFKKIRAPKPLFDLLRGHWERNKENKKKESWPPGNIYVNHWESPTYMVSVEDSSLRGGGYNLKQKIWDAVKPTIEEWTGMEQKPSSQYGIRVYTEGAVLNPHADRLPLVSSCIVNVAQDVDEDWVLEVIDRQGRAVNVTMHPGDLVLYESGSLIHGRPWPLKGRFYANIFIHFEPTGRKLGDATNDFLDELDDFFPPYIQLGSEEATYWARRNPQGWHKPSPSSPLQQVSAPAGHHAAATGDLDRLKNLVQQDPKLLHTKDANGWQPIHEAVRGGHSDVIEFLVEHGADINARTGPMGTGQSPLSLARDYENVGSVVSDVLVRLGAVEIDEL